MLVESEPVRQANPNFPQGRLGYTALAGRFDELFINVLLTVLTDLHVYDALGAREARFTHYAPFIVDQVAQVLDHDPARELMALLECREFLLDTQIVVGPPVALEGVTRCNVAGVLVQAGFSQGRKKCFLVPSSLGKIMV